MTAKDQAAFEAINAMRALKQYDDFDAAIYFDMAARQLLGCHGARAIQLADAALIRMRALGDREGCELWEEVRNAMAEYADEIPPPRLASLH